MKKHLVGGQWEPGDRSEAVIAPYSGEALAEVSVASASQLERAMAAARAAQAVVGALHDRGHRRSTGHDDVLRAVGQRQVFEQARGRQQRLDFADADVVDLANLGTNERA